MTGRGKPKRKKINIIQELRQTSPLWRALEAKQGMPDDEALEIVKRRTEEEGLDIHEQDELYYDLTTHPFSSEALGQD